MIQEIRMGKKTNKTLYLPDWVIELLDDEGDSFGGPGVIAAASIFDFCRKKIDAKKRILKDYYSDAVETTYGCAGTVDVSRSTDDSRSEITDADQAASEVVLESDSEGDGV